MALSFFADYVERFSNPRCMKTLFLLFAMTLFVACNDQEPDLVHRSQINYWQYITSEHGLPSDHINTIFEDSKGNFWFGTNRGLSVLSGNNLSTYTIGNGLLDDNVFAISEDRNGYIWVGTGRGVNLFADEQWSYLAFFYQAPVYDIIALEDDSSMLIGTGGYGVYQFKYDTKGFKVFDFIEGCISCNTINSIFEAKDKSVWIASSEGARRLRDSYVTNFDSEDGMSGRITTTITEDSWGNIWIGSVEGKFINKIRGNHVSQISFNNGAVQNFIFGIQEDNQGSLWVGTVGNGLFRYDGAIMKQVQDGPPGKTITALLKDSKGNIWVGTTDAGIGYYRMQPNRK